VRRCPPQSTGGGAYASAYRVGGDVEQAWDSRGYEYLRYLERDRQQEAEQQARKYGNAGARGGREGQEGEEAEGQVDEHVYGEVIKRQSVDSRGPGVQEDRERAHAKRDGMEMPGVQRSIRDQNDSQEEETPQAQ